LSSLFLNDDFTEYSLASDPWIPEAKRYLIEGECIAQGQYDDLESVWTNHHGVFPTWRKSHWSRPTDCNLPRGISVATTRVPSLDLRFFSCRISIGVQKPLREGQPIDVDDGRRFRSAMNMKRNDDSSEALTSHRCCLRSWRCNRSGVCCSTRNEGHSKQAPNSLLENMAFLP